MRFLSYIISGIVSALFGWSLSQILWVDLGRENLPIWSGFILLPITAACFAASTVTTEIFLSNPTRYKACRQVLFRFIWLALVTGFLAGSLAAGFSWILHISNATDLWVRTTTWSLIGLFTGLGESVSWRFRSIEGATEKAKQRIWKASVLGLLAGLFAALLVEILRRYVLLGGYEDPVGFLILGLCLGLCLSIATAPTYSVALRAGAGFEAIDSNYDQDDRPLPCLNSEKLRFVTIDDYETIEEGLSIQLPTKTKSKKPILIGSRRDSDIVIPDIPLDVASLKITRGKVELRCLKSKAVQVQARFLEQGSRPVVLRHNQILTFHPKNGNHEKFYRFVFYDRFLDPEA